MAAAPKKRGRPPKPRDDDEAPAVKKPKTKASSFEWMAKDEAALKHALSIYGTSKQSTEHARTARNRVEQHSKN